MNRAPFAAAVLGAIALAGCTFDQPARWPPERWSEMHRELKTRVVAAHRAPLLRRCEPPAEGETTRIGEFDALWRYDQPWPPVGDFASQVGPLDDFLIELGYAYLTAKEANPRRAFVVFSEHAHRFPGSARGRLGRVHAHLTIGDLSSAEQALADLPDSRTESRGRGREETSRREGEGAAAAAAVAGDATLPAPRATQEAEFVRWLMGYLNCRPAADGRLDRGPEKNGAEDLAGTDRPVKFLGMEQLKEPPRPGPLSYVGFMLTPVTFFGERVIDLVQRDDAPRLPRWPDLAVLPGRGADESEPRTWHVAGFMRAQAPGAPELDRDWKDRAARFLGCSLRPRWAGQWVPRLHDAPDLGYFPHYAEVYATIGRLALVQGGRPTLDDLCDALTALLLASHQDPVDPVTASEVAWLWYSAMQRDDPQMALRQPYLDGRHRFGEHAVLWAAQLLLGSAALPTTGAGVRELHGALERAGALGSSGPFREDGPLAIAALRVLAALLFQVGPEVRQVEGAGDRLTRVAQEIVKRLALPGTRDGDAAAGRAADPWRLTPRDLPGAAGAEVAPARRPLEPWFDAVFADCRWLLESWLGALEGENRGDPAMLERCALVRDRLWYAAPGRERR